MKTINKIKLMFLGVLMFTTLLAISNTTPAKDQGKTAPTEKTIRDYFKFPQMLIPNNVESLKAPQKVEVLFTTDRNGAVNFVLAKTDNSRLKTEIEKQFRGIRLQSLNSGVVHSIVLSFRSL